MKDRPAGNRIYGCPHCGAVWSSTWQDLIRGFPGDRASFFVPSTARTTPCMRSGPRCSSTVSGSGSAGARWCSTAGTSSVSVDPRSHVCVAAHSGDHNHQSGDSPHGDCLYQPFLEHHPTVVHRDRLETCDHLGCRYGVGDSPRACDCRSDVSESLSHDPMIP